MSYPPLIDLKNGFWPVVHLLYGVSEWNFTDMLTINVYILWVRIVTLTFPDCELSTLDWSENWFLTCSSLTWVFMHRIFFKFFIHIVIGDEWYGIVNGQNPTIFDGVTALSLFKKWFLACYSFYCLWYLNETSQICWTAKVTYYNEGPSLLPFQFMSYPPLINLEIFFDL